MPILNSHCDSTTLGYLGKALSLELSAVQLYSTQAKLVEAWGLPDIASKLADEANEELEHSNRIITRMLALGYAPNASQLKPVKLGTNIQQLLEYNVTFENELIALYTRAVNHCIAKADNDNRLFFAGLLAEEQSHAKDLAEWLQTIRSPS